MGMKFLNKKGWHTGSLRNIENVWKAEQKHEAEQRKLEELRKQIHEERERSEFRLLQEQAGLIPKQERLDFLYDSGLAVGKGSSDGFKPLESFPSKPEPESAVPANKPSAPGALFEDRPQSANDAWRKLHSDPLLMIRQREQEALARVKNNPVQMAMIRKSVEAKKQKEGTSDREKHKGKHHHKKSKHEKRISSKHHIDSEDDIEQKKREEERSISPRRDSKYKENAKTERLRNIDKRTSSKHRIDSEDDIEQKKREEKRSISPRRDSKYKENAKTERVRNIDRNQHERYHEEERFVSETAKREDREDRKHYKISHNRQKSSTQVLLSKEDRAAKLKEMQMDAELHEEQRWRRLKQADDDDAKEVTHASSSGRNFLDAAHKSVYGADKGGSSTIEESVRRRTHYSQRKSDGNAFRR